MTSGSCYGDVTMMQARQIVEVMSVNAAPNMAVVRTGGSHRATFSHRAARRTLPR